MPISSTVAHQSRPSIIIPSAPVRVCLPTGAVHPPDGPEWLHEIKHDGFRMIARRDGERVRLISRRGLDWGDRFGTIVAAVETLAVRSCVIDGEAIVCDGDGLAAVHLCAFDLIELDGHDLRREPIETRKGELARVLDACRPGLGAPPKPARNPIPQEKSNTPIGEHTIKCIGCRVRTTIDGQEYLSHE